MDNGKIEGDRSVPECRLAFSILFWGHIIVHASAGPDIVTFPVQPGAPVVNQTLTGLALREKYGINMLAVKRDETVMANPAADFKFQADDLVFTLTLPENITGAQEVFWVE